MIRKEIEIIALEKSVSIATIDKDWVLGHLLNAFYSIGNNKENFIFKGGTCLKKCYFENYRFSEDLDFTLLDRDFAINRSFINKITKIASENTNIKFSLAEIKNQIHNNIQQGYEVKIKFWGADHKLNTLIPPPNRWQTYIKLDISFSEQVFETPNNCLILHKYSDSHLINEMIPSYSLLEIMSEKLRALIQRNRPRDIYDIWYIMNSSHRPDMKAIKELLQQKAKSKNIIIESVDQFVNNEKMKKNKRAWENSLSLHLPINSLPNFDMVYSNIHRIITSIINS